MSKDLVAFGAKLKALRTEAGLSLTQLLDRLDAIHANAGAVGDLPISSQLLWNWERAYSYKGRRWTPKQQYILYLIDLFSEHLTLEEATKWAAQAGYQLSKQTLQSLPLASIDGPPIQAPALPTYYIERRSLEQSIVESINVGVQTVVLWGNGGMGKSTLAAALARSLLPNFPDGIIWITVTPDDQVGDIFQTLADELGITLSRNSLGQQARHLHSHLRKKRYLLILDDLWAMQALDQLRLGSSGSRLLCTTRDRKVAPVLQARALRINGFTEAESVGLLAAWGDQTERKLLAQRLGGIPLALNLAIAQLDNGLPLGEFLSIIHAENIDLSLLDLDDPQTQYESLQLSFDISYNKLTVDSQKLFTHLRYFKEHHFSQMGVQAIWQVEPNVAYQALKQLLRFAFIEQDGPAHYKIHPLLHKYASAKQSSSAVDEQNLRYRHATCHIHTLLAHPRITEVGRDPRWNINKTWGDVKAAVLWAATHDPQLATQAALLAHTERSILVEALGQPLSEAIRTYLDQATTREIKAVLHELLGEIYSLQGKITQGAAQFEAASDLWKQLEDGLASSEATLRSAGLSLLAGTYERAAEQARLAQSLFEQSLPLDTDTVPQAEALFYWLEMIYMPLVRWDGLPEQDLSNLVTLANCTHRPLLQARATHLHRLWCTENEPPRDPEKGKRLAIVAYKLWKRAGRPGRGDDEISLTQYALKKRYSRRTARRFARRRVQTTPRITIEQIRLLQNKGLRWWLTASDQQRIDWLSWMLPRYQKAHNRPIHSKTGTRLPSLTEGSEAHQWVEIILNVGALGQGRRRLSAVQTPPAHHLVNSTEWQALSGQRPKPLLGRKRRLVHTILETQAIHAYL
ncbi:MAG: NB-ARC domain-containing protein [Chloroflexota bacterium]